MCKKSNQKQLLKFLIDFFHKFFMCLKGRGSWKQWKLKPEMENGNGQNSMQMNARVKPLINDHLLKTTLCKDHLCTKTT